MWQMENRKSDRRKGLHTIVIAIHLKDLNLLINKMPYQHGIEVQLLAASLSQCFVNSWAVV